MGETLHVAFALDSAHAAMTSGNRTLESLPSNAAPLARRFVRKEDLHELLADGDDHHVTHHAEFHAEDLEVCAHFRDPVVCRMVTITYPFNRI